MMTTVAILPVESAEGLTTFQAISGSRTATGETAGEALDALSAQFPDIEDEPLLVIRRFRPDEFFSGEQQDRLAELMRRWRRCRDEGNSLTAAELAELEALVEAEVAGAGRRASAVAREIGR